MKYSYCPLEYAAALSGRFPLVPRNPRRCLGLIDIALSARFPAAKTIPRTTVNLVPFDYFVFKKTNRTGLNYCVELSYKIELHRSRDN